MVVNAPMQYLRPDLIQVVLSYGWLIQHALEVSERLLLLGNRL